MKTLKRWACLHFLSELTYLYSCLNLIHQNILIGFEWGSTSKSVLVCSIWNYNHNSMPLWCRYKVIVYNLGDNSSVFSDLRTYIRGFSVANLVLLAMQSSHLWSVKCRGWLHTGQTTISTCLCVKNTWRRFVVNG